MRTQSPDTSPEMERIMIEQIRQFPSWRKFAVASSLSTTLAQGLFQQGPDAYVCVLYGQQWERRYHALCQKQTHLKNAQPDIAQSILHICAYLSSRHIPFAFGPGIAISIYGLPETAYTLEIYVDYPRQLNCFPVLTRIGNSYFDPLHLMQVTMITHPALVARAHAVHLEEQAAVYPVLSPEDVIIILLKRFRESGYTDDALYNGLLGVLKVQHPTLDLSYLHACYSTDTYYQQVLEDAGVVA